MEIWERLEGAINKANEFDNSTFVKSFDKVCKDYIKDKDKKIADIIATIEPLIDEIEQLSNDFMDIEKKNKHGKVPVTWKEVTIVKAVKL